MGFRQYREIHPGEFFVVGADTSQGGKDYSTAIFISKTNLDIPLVYQSPSLATVMTNKVQPVLEKLYDVTGVAPVIAYERNAGGIFEFERLAALNRAGKYKIYTMMTYGDIVNANERKIGWDTNTATRPKMLADLKDAIDNRLLAIYDKNIISEMYSFIIGKQGKAEAEAGSHDDLVMATAIAWQLYQSESPTAKRSIPRPYERNKWAIG